MEHRHAILLVEDDWNSREAFTAFLASEGLDTVAVRNGREALERLRAGLRPCLIILDLAMPEMNGFEFRRAQLADPALARIPVVVNSAAGFHIERESRSLGMTVFPSKPPSLDELLAAVGRHCRRA